MAATARQERARQLAGLSMDEARRRLAEQGRNEIEKTRGASPVRRFLANLVQPLELLVWACAGVGLLRRDPR